MIIWLLGLRQSFTECGNGVVGVVKSDESKLLFVRICDVDEAEPQRVWQDAVSNSLDDVFDEVERRMKRSLIVATDCIDYED